MEDVRELKEFVVKHCRVVCFSGGGQYFAFAHNAQVGKDRLSVSRIRQDASSKQACLHVATGVALICGTARGSSCFAFATVDFLPGTTQ